MKDKSYAKVIQYAKDISDSFTNQYGSKISRSLHITGAAVTAGIFIAIGKLVMGILAMSFFACANAFYSFGMIGAKSVVLTGIRKAQNTKEQHQYYLFSGVVLSATSMLYIIYSIRLFFFPVTSSYDMNVAIGIAAVTFTEIGLSFRGVIVTRHNHTILIQAIKMINLSVSLIALVLTQTALLSFTNKEADTLEISKANGVIGILMGTVATLIGFYMIFRIKKLKRQSDLLIIEQDHK